MAARRGEAGVGGEVHCGIGVFGCDRDKELRNGTDLDLQAYQDRAKREIFDPLLDRGG